MDVSVLISVHNRIALTRACVDSLFATMPDNCAWELLFYDDQSTDATAEYLSSLQAHQPRVQVLRESERGWFARNNNRLAARARGRWLLFLNNDTICLPGWFAPLYAMATKADAGQSNAAVIGGLQVFPDRQRINHAGVVIDHRGLPSHLYEGLSAELPAAQSTREMQAVTAACWLANARRFHELNGFFEGFRNGYEDIDYCLRVRQANAQVWYCGASRIIHYGGCTSARFDHELENQALFRRRTRAHSQDDLATTVRRDGVRWPAHTIWYRGARALWTGPLVAPIAQRLLRFRMVIRLRQKMIRLLVPSAPITRN